MPALEIFTTGVRPRLPRVRPRGGFSPGRPRPRSRRTLPGPRPSFYMRPPLLVPGRDRLLVALDRPTGRDLPGDPEPGEHLVQTARGAVVDREPLFDQGSDSRERPALVEIPVRARALLDQREQFAVLALDQQRPIAASALRGQRRDAAGLKGATPPVDRHLRHPEPRCHLLVTLTGPMNSTAASRTCSRRARAASSSPPPCAYLTHTA